VDDEHPNGSVSFSVECSFFDNVLGQGLIRFGAYLITLGLPFDKEGGKKWVNGASSS